MGVLIHDEIPAQIPGPNEHHRATAATPYMVPTRPGRLRSSHRRKPVHGPRPAGMSALEPPPQPRTCSPPAGTSACTTPDDTRRVPR